VLSVANVIRYCTMSIEGVSHITFIVRDLERMARFLCEEYFDNGDRHARIQGKRSSVR
jgi:hypothetical protein